MIIKKYKTFKINLSENDCKCYLIERIPQQETSVQKIDYENLLILLKKEIYQFNKENNKEDNKEDNKENNKHNDNDFFIKFFGSLFSIYFFISVILYNLIN